MTEFLPNSLAARDIAHHFHSYTNLKKHEELGPLVVTRGKGIRVIDEDGKDYIEALGGLWYAALGFSEERLAKAAYDQMIKLPAYHTFAGKSHDPVILLAEKLKRIAPVPMGRIYFANSGSEANDTAVKMIWYYNNALGRPRKKKIIARHRAYHGVTVMAASLSGLPMMQTGFDLPVGGILRARCPHYYREGQDGESEEAFVDRLARELEDLILAEDPDTIAAMFAEPVQGAGGVVVPPETYFPRIQAVLKKYDILLVADEVITGYGRTGNWFGTETFGIEPDFITTAKALTSGYQPMSALMVAEHVFEPIKAFSDKNGVFGHGYTYSGHPTAAAVALENLRIYEEMDLIGHVRGVMGHFQARLEALAEHPLIGEARFCGLVGALECVADKASKRAFDPKVGVGPRLMAAAQTHGVITRAMGDSIAFSPPLIITREEIDELFDRVGEALDEVEAWVESEGVRG